MNQPDMRPVRSLFSHFSYGSAFAAPTKTIKLGVLREWCADPRILAPLWGDSWESAFRNNPDRLRYFSATDPEHPHVPLLRVDGTDSSFSLSLEPLNQKLTADTAIRDKLWQRLVMEQMAVLLQPGFAAVNGNRIEARSAPGRVHIEALDCRPLAELTGSTVPPDTVVLVEGIDVGFVAAFSGDGVRVASQNSHVVRLLGGDSDRLLSVAEWDEFVRVLGTGPLPIGVEKAAQNTSRDLGEALLSQPGAYILKPRFGSNGFGVVRVVSRADGRLVAESDCPDTAQYLEDFPCDSAQCGRDLIAGVGTQRRRFVDRARAGVPEQLLDFSILEDEIRQDRAGGAIFEPRVVVQRTKDGPAGAFAVLGAICKEIDTAVGASVARDFRENILDHSLERFLCDRVPASDLTGRVKETREEILASGDRIRAALVPLIEARGACVHQFGIDSRLCWNGVTDRAECQFLEFQFGIGRIDPSVLNSGGLVGYRSPKELDAQYGPKRVGCEG